MFFCTSSFRRCDAQSFAGVAWYCGLILDPAGRERGLAYGLSSYRYLLLHCGTAVLHYRIDLRANEADCREITWTPRDRRLFWDETRLNCHTALLNTVLSLLLGSVSLSECAPICNIAHSIAT